MAESGRRNLPAKASLAAGKLQQAVGQQTLPAVANAPRDAKTISFLNKHIRRTRLLSDAAVQKGEELAQKLQQAACLLQLAAAFETKPFLTDEGIASLQMKLLKRQAQKTIVRYQQQWIKVQFAIARLQAELQRADELKIM